MPSLGHHLRKRSSSASLTGLLSGANGQHKHSVVHGMDDAICALPPRSPSHSSLYDEEPRPRRARADPSAVKARMPSQLTMLADSLSLSPFDETDPLLAGTLKPVTPASLFDDDDDEMSTDQEAVVVEGGEWAQTLYGALDPACHSAVEGVLPASLTRMYDGPPLPRTAFASYPRSGNTYIRGLVERSTGFRTTSTYCDKTLAKSFLGECDKGPGSFFFKKTHYPALSGRSKSNVEEWNAMDFDRVVQVVRNPMDALYSYWTFEEVRRLKLTNSENKHTLHLNVTVGETELQVDQVLFHADRWNLFHDLWSQAAIPKLHLRYEDLRAAPLPPVLQLVSFILPPDALPPLADIACALTLDESRQAYKSSKSAPFSSWDRFTPSLREEVIKRTSRWWCEFGYDEALKQAKGTSGGVNCDELMKKKLKSIPRIVET